MKRFCAWWSSTEAGAADVHVKFAGPIAAAREVNGQEQPVGPADVDERRARNLVQGLSAAHLCAAPGAAPAQLNAVESQPVTLNYDLAAASNDDTKSVGGFDSKGDALPAEMLPTAAQAEWRRLQAAPAATGKPDARGRQRPGHRPARRRLQSGLRACRRGDGDQQAAFRAGAHAGKPDRRRLGRIHRPVGHAHLEAAARYGHRGRRTIRQPTRASGCAAQRLGGLCKSCDLGSQQYRLARLVARLIPRTTSVCGRATSSPQPWPGSHRITTRPTD